MKIVLDSSLVTRPRYRAFEYDEASVGGFARSLTHAIKLTPKAFIGAELPDGVEALGLGWLGMVADCYSRHEKLQVQPHDLWFIVLTELAVEVNENSDKYRALFTNSAEKQTIMVPTGNECLLDPKLVTAHLANLVNIPIEQFLPTLSTADEDVVTAFSAAFCDLVKSYYSYGTFCCGIPEIEVTGTVKDWVSLILCCDKLIETFQAPAMWSPIPAYLRRTREIFIKIADTVRGQDPRLNIEFWKGIFTSKNVGSGGQLEITGWVKDLYLKKRPNSQLENYTGSFGVVPYFNAETKREFTTVYGAFSVLRSPEGFQYCSYDSFVFERNPE